MKRLRVDIECANAAFTDCEHWECRRILGELAKKLDYGELLPIKLMDVNGNCVGWAREPDRAARCPRGVG